MDTNSLVLSYAAAAVVAGIVTLAFSSSINRVLKKLIPEEVAQGWGQFVKFALFVASFAGGMPLANPGRFIDRNAPAVTPPIEGAELMMVMRSVGGALTAASWTLLVFFGVTLLAYTARQLMASFKERRAAEAKELERREAEQRAAKAKQDAGAGKRDEPLKRPEPAAASSAPSKP